MGIRKNVKFLSPAERENFVKACVLMKADIVNPGAAPAAQYSRWDEYVAIHDMIQDGIAPGGINVNFGHGGDGSFGFLSWHRYFLFQFEQQLQGYVPGVMLPYWDWTDPASVMTDTFLGPNGNPANRNVVERGYFAFDRPGAGSNPTPLPAWWPASLDGWRMSAMFAANFQGGLKRRTGTVSQLPSAAHVRTALSRTDYRSFQNTVESGTGLIPANGMHNSMHGWIGGGFGVSTGHMTSPAVSPFDPFFYLHHCNVDRLWAMWQMDGHLTEYPASGGDPGHHRDDPMYPWTGSLTGFGTTASIAAAIPMPDFSAVGVKRNVDTLDFRAAFGYTYDTLPIIGVGLDQTGSMNGLTPDPMTTGAPDVTKWEAAKRGVAAFLHDCETVQNSGIVYVMAGVRTFRSLGGNVFTPVFGAPGYGLVKAGTPFSRAAFDASAGAMAPGGGTPLADALLDVQHTLVEPPFGGRPVDEQRYIAMFTDGIATSGSPLSAIAAGSLNRTAVFAMGFGTGLDVDYATLAEVVAKGRPLATQQVFHGENAGTIDKFFSNALAAAIGFTSVFDPVIELYEGEHAHLSFTATSADDAFYLTAQGVDFTDKHWSFTLHGPNGQVVYGNHQGHQHHADACHHCCPAPDITALRANGRLSMIIQRGNAGKDCWVGSWELMIAYKAQRLDRMMMPELGELLFPVSAGPIKGARYARLLTRPDLRTPTRKVFGQRAHNLDNRAVSTNSSNKPACSVVVNVYARTNLKVNLTLNTPMVRPGEPLEVTLLNDVATGRIKNNGGFARLVAPAFDLEELIPKEKVRSMIEANEKSQRFSAKLDPTLQLARMEKDRKDLQFIRDEAVAVVSHGDSPLHIHYEGTAVKGTYHLGVVVEGLYFPGGETKTGDNSHGHNGPDHPAPEGDFEVFSRVLTTSFSVS